MKVVLAGFKYFSDYLSKELMEFSSKDKFISLDTYGKSIDKLKYLYHIRNADVLYYINGTVDSSKVIDLAIRLKKKVIFHWVGSDVEKAKIAHSKNLMNLKYLTYPKHLTDTPWFVDDLNRIGINAVFAPLKAIQIQSIKEFPSEFSVLTYIQKGNEDFYGMKSIVKAAKELPNIQFNILALDKYNEKIPENIKLLGWQKDVKQFINNNVVSIRIPKTDGLSFFVLESLSLQRHVIYSKKFESCLNVNNDIQLIETLQNLKQQFDMKKLELNIAGSQFVVKNFDRQVVLSTIYNHIRE